MAWAHVQGKAVRVSTGNSTTLSATFDGTVTAGNLILVRFGTYGGTSFTVQDSVNSTPYSEAILWGPTGTTGNCNGIYWYVAATGGSLFEVTMTSTTGGYPSMTIDEYSFSPNATISVDDSDSAYATYSTNPALASALTVTGNDLICTAISIDNMVLTTFTPTTGLSAGPYIDWVSNVAEGIHTEDGLNITTDITPSSTIAPVGYWLLTAVALKETGGSPPPTQHSALLMEF